MLEKYYNERFKQKGDPEFKDLSEDDKKSIEQTIDFCSYQWQMVWKDIGKQLYELINNLAKQLKRNK